MARLTSFTPLAAAAAIVGAVLIASRLAADRVGALLGGASRQQVEAVDAVTPEAGLPAARSATEDEGEGDEPTVDLEYPSEKDWRFLEGVLKEGSPQARRSAAKALVMIGRLRGVDPLLQAAAAGDEDADLFCMAALEVLRLQRQEDVLPVLLRNLVAEDSTISQSCRSEISDRFVLAGGRDEESLARLAGHDDPAVRRFVAGYLAEVDPVGYAELLADLARDPDPEVRERAIPAADAGER